MCFLRANIKLFTNVHYKYNTYYELIVPIPGAYGRGRWGLTIFQLCKISHIFTLKNIYHFFKIGSSILTGVISKILLNTIFS